MKAWCLNWWEKYNRTDTWLLVHWCSFFFFSSRRRHTRSKRDWSSDVCSSDLRWLHTAVGHQCACGYHIHDRGRGTSRYGTSSPVGRVHGNGAESIRSAIASKRSEERRVGKECRDRWSAYQ